MAIINGLKLYNNLTSQTLVKSDVDNTSYSIPRFVKGDILPVTFYLMEENSDITSLKPFNVVLSTAYNLKIGLFKKEDKTCLAFTSDFENLDGINITGKTGIFALNTQEITDYLNGKDYANVVFEIEVRDNNGDAFTTYQNEVLLINDYIEQENYSVIPTEEIATANWCKSSFISKIGTTHEQFILISPSGFQFLIFIDDNGQFNISRLQ